MGWPASTMTDPPLGSLVCGGRACACAGLSMGRSRRARTRAAKDKALSLAVNCQLRPGGHCHLVVLASRPALDQRTSTRSAEPTRPEPSTQAGRSVCFATHLAFAGLKTKPAWKCEAERV